MMQNNDGIDAKWRSERTWLNDSNTFNSGSVKRKLTEMLAVSWLIESYADRPFLSGGTDTNQNSAIYLVATKYC